MKTSSYQKNVIGGERLAVGPLHSSAEREDVLARIIVHLVLLRDVRENLVP
ncbi:hypothetical protein ABN028_06070 [Actinopolymorpha sp. B17G11]|uniref:hypothetical protein n=1 Tax=unclassified Actinopolymorpha TaxID=2627063 RepID=UPI0032D9A7A4